MTELEKIAYARMYIDKLSKGINPLDDTFVPDDDIVNNVRISRCLFYVSDVLGQIISNEQMRQRRQKKHKKEYFDISKEALEHFNYSQTPITLSEFCKRLESMVDLSAMRRISRSSLPLWLVHLGMLQAPVVGSHKYSGGPTELGLSVGVTKISYMRNGRQYELNALTLEGQRFVIDNFEAFLVFRERRKIKINDPE